MNDKIVSIKGIRDGVLITLSPTEEWHTLTEALAARIDEKADFFAGARVTVDFGQRPVPKVEMLSLKALLERRNMILSAVLSESLTTIDAALALDIRTTSSGVPGHEPEESAPIDPEEEGTAGVMLRRTLRSGRTIHSRGHVVVVGDVNPGAVIVATGDIIVWGRLRGTVHAGAEGDESAIVCALDMMPNQLRIAGYIVTSPQVKRRRPQPEVAMIRDNQIVVEAWS